MGEIMNHPTRPEQRDVSELIYDLFNPSEMGKTSRLKERFMYVWDFFMVPVFCLIAFAGVTALLGGLIFKLFN